MARPRVWHVQTFPAPVHAYEPGATEHPTLSSPRRFLLWLLWRQRWLFGVSFLVILLWQVPPALMPWLMGHAIDQGIVRNDPGAAVFWAMVLLVVVVLGVLGGVASHTAGVSGWLVAMYRGMALTVRKALQLGHVLPRRTPTGEVLSVTSNDSDVFGAVAVNTAMTLGSLASFATAVTVIMQLNWRLGLVVLVATPIIVASGLPLMRPLSDARRVERTRSSTLTGMATDIVAGLRILRGIGGEKTFGDNYARQSQNVKKAGIVAALWQVGVDTLAILLGGLLLVVLTWFGVAEMRAGRLSVGGLISFFGYAVMLVGPIQTVLLFFQRWVQGVVSSAKTVGVLEQESPWAAPDDAVAFPSGQPIVDEQSGVTIEPGRFTVVVSAAPDESASLADRLGRYLASRPEETSCSDGDNPDELKGRAARRSRAAKREARLRLAAEDAERARRPWGVTVGGVDLSRISLDDVRRHIVVSDTAAGLFAGTLQTAIDPLGRATREEAERAMYVAAAEDIFDALPGGWQGRIDEKGRGLSGGQRQRVVLARAVLTDAETLVLVEPTSAVDAHTEARIARRLADYRRGRTTVVMSVSPLLLHQCDEAVLLVDGKLAARGRHEELLASSPEYRSVVARGMDEEVPA